MIDQFHFLMLTKIINYFRCVEMVRLMTLLWIIELFKDFVDFWRLG